MLNISGRGSAGRSLPLCLSLREAVPAAAFRRPQLNVLQEKLSITSRRTPLVEDAGHPPGRPGG